MPSASEAPRNENPVQQVMTVARLDRTQRLSEAWQRLEEDLIGFLRRMKEGGESGLGRNPASDDLIPYFQQLAWALIEINHKAKVLAAPTLAEARTRIGIALDSSLTAICQPRPNESGRGKRDSVWVRSVKRACDAVDLGIWRTPYGHYRRDVFMRPKRVQLRALLAVQAQTLIQEFLASKAKQVAVPEIDQVESAIRTPAFPERAQWAKARIDERGWNKETLHTKGGPDAKTTRKILRGDAVSETTLEKLAEALSKYRGDFPLPPASKSDIPNK